VLNVLQIYGGRTVTEPTTQRQRVEWGGQSGVRAGVRAECRRAGQTGPEGGILACSRRVRRVGPGAGEVGCAVTGQDFRAPSSGRKTEKLEI